MGIHTAKRRIPWLDDEDEDREYSAWNARAGNDDLEEDDIDDADLDGEDEEWDGYDTIDDYTNEEGPVWKHLPSDPANRLPYEEAGFLEKPSRGSRKRFANKRRR